VEAGKRGTTEEPAAPGTSLHPFLQTSQHERAALPSSRAAPASLRVDLVTDPAEFLALEPAWRALAERCPDATVFQTWEWNRAWWAAFGQHRQLFVVVARAGERVAGIAPLTRRRVGPLRLLEFLGAGRSDYPNFLVEVGAGALEALLAALRARADAWEVLWLRDLVLPEGEPERLRAAVRSVGLDGTIRPWDRAPYLALEGSWEGYLARRSSNFRSDLKRKRRRLEEAGPVTIERYCDPAGVGRGLGEAAEIERRSWKQAAGSARMVEAAGRQFFQTAAAALAGAGKTDLWLLRCGEPAVAFYLNFTDPGGVRYYSGTYRSDFQAMSPGKVLMAEVIRAAFAEGPAVFDFLRGEEAYKATWTDTSRPLFEAFIHSGRPIARAATWLLADVLLPAKRHPRGQALVERLQRARAGHQPGAGNKSDGSSGTIAAAS
jgi:CelD/BcsL family acetyltransferase involved in cellulose biosynthesis